MADVIIDRGKLVDFIKQHAQEIADRAIIDLRTVKVEGIDGTVQFKQSLDVEMQIPLEAVEVQS